MSSHSKISRPLIVVRESDGVPSSTSILEKGSTTKKKIGAGGSSGFP